MTKKQQSMEDMRELFIEGFEINRIAQILNKTQGTIQQYKSEDKKAGNDWDELRAENMKKTLSKMEEDDLYLTFSNQMYKAISSINSDEKLKPLEKTQALAQIADSYSKIIKIAYKTNPEKYIFAVVDSHITLLIETIEELGNMELYNQLVESLKSELYLKKLAKIKDKYLDEIMIRKDR